MKRRLVGSAAVVALDHPADGEARVVAGERERGIEVVAADIVEIDVDAVGRGSGQALEDRRRPCSRSPDRRRASGRTRISLPRRPSRSPSCPWPWRSARPPSRPRPPRRRRRPRRLPWPRRRRAGRNKRCAGHPELAEELLGRNAEVGQLLRGARGDDRLVAPAGHVLDEVARREAVGLALDHLADRAAVHRLAELERRHVAFHVVHSAAHVGVDRQPAGCGRGPCRRRAAAARRPSSAKLSSVGMPFGRLFRCQARAIVVSS